MLRIVSFCSRFIGRRIQFESHFWILRCAQNDIENYYFNNLLIIKETKNMNRKNNLLLVSLSAIMLDFGWQNQSIGKDGSLSRVKVAVFYENITDGVLIGRIIDSTINLLKETKADLIFRGFLKWAPVVNSPDSIPPELLELAPNGTTLEQAATALKNSGHYYQELKRWISSIKNEMPDLIFIGAIPTQTLARIEYNPVTGKVYSKEETWGMALDPQKWNIKNNDTIVTK